MGLIIWVRTWDRLKISFENLSNFGRGRIHGSMQYFSPKQPSGSKESPRTAARHAPSKAAKWPVPGHDHELFDDRFEVIECIGEGATSIVFRAKHRLLQKEMAVKVLIDRHGAVPEARQRFLQEARLLANLSHPSIVRVHTIGNLASAPYVAMDLVDGESLQQVMDARRLDVNESVRLVGMIAGALAVAHHKGIIHRDVKPSNIMLTGATRIPIPVLVDFGSGCKIQGKTPEQPRDKFVGTPAYMSPEQFDNMDVDARSDVYSLGCVLYEMVSGKVPFAVKGVRRAAVAHAYQSPPQLPASTPGWLADLIFSMLEKNPADRPQSMRTVKRALAERRWDRVKPGAGPSFLERLGRLCMETCFAR